jgi:protein-tyrosine phosphatase
MLRHLFSKFFSSTPHILFSSLGTDIHSHLIPGIDDGAQNMDESIALVKDLYYLGFRKIVTTPHIMADFYKNTPEIILSGLDKLKLALRNEGIIVDISAAAEYYLDEFFVDKIGKEELLTFGDNYVLFELSFINKQPNLADVIFQLKTNGYKPVLAHPERYRYWNKNIVAECEKIKETGAYLQLNTISLTGFYGKDVRKNARDLIDSGLIDFIGSDTHKTRHLQALNLAEKDKYIQKLLNSGTLLNSKI